MAPEWIGLRDQRAEAARENGKKGEKPRTNAPVPGPRWIPLPIVGGGGNGTAAETQETESETQLETLSRGRLLSPEKQSSEEREENGVLVLLKELVELGALHPKEGGNLEVARGWLQSGATLPAMPQAFLATKRSKAPRLASIGYFTRIVEDLLTEPATAPTASRADCPARRSGHRVCPRPERGHVGSLCTRGPHRSMPAYDRKVAGWGGVRP